MKRLLCLLMSTCFATSVAAAGGPPIIEIFGCNLKQGQTMADFDRAAAAWAAQADSLPANRSYFAAVLKPYRVVTPYDVVWIGSNPNMDDWAKAGIAGMASAAEQAALAAIDAAVSCESALHAETAIYEGLKDEPGDVDAVIETFVCSLKPGKTAKDVAAYDAAFIAASNALKLTTYSAYHWAPLYDKGDVHAIYLIANDDLEGFASGFDAWVGSKEGQAANAALADTFNCDGGLWMGHILHQPAATTP